MKHAFIRLLDFFNYDWCIKIIVSTKVFIFSLLFQITFLSGDDCLCDILEVFFTKVLLANITYNFMRISNAK